MTECGSRAVRLVLAEDLSGEGRVVAEPSLCECVVERLERGIAKCGRSVKGEFGVLLVPDDGKRQRQKKSVKRNEPKKKNYRLSQENGIAVVHK